MKHLSNNFPLSHTYKDYLPQVIIQWMSAPAGHMGAAQTRDMFYVRVYFTTEQNKRGSVAFEVAEHDGNWYPGQWVNQRFAPYNGNDFTKKLIPALLRSYSETEKISEEEINGFFE
jgi:hypothetical protein